MTPEQREALLEDARKLLDEVAADDAAKATAAVATPAAVPAVVAVATTGVAPSAPVAPVAAETGPGGDTRHSGLMSIHDTLMKVVTEFNGKV